LMAGYPVADPLAAIVVAAIIALNAIGLFRENLCLLLGRSPGPEYLRNIERLAHTVPGVQGVHEIHAEYVGPDSIRAGLHIEVEPTLTVESAEHISREMRRRLEASIGCRYCLVHVDPAGVAVATAGVGANGLATTPSNA
jgi:ferrous-iron efflux pump FieF